MDNKTRKLYYADNLPVLRNMADESVDLIYLDPPFNSNKTYNIICPDDKAQAPAFTDVWHWGRQEDTYLKEISQLHIKAIDVIQALVNGLGKVQLCAYLVNMTVRLVELHRLLKPTGSLYLHCDPTASHYLKVVLDGVFGNRNFRNEVVWSYRSGGVSKKWYGRKHDILLFYTKNTSKNHTFNVQKERSYCANNIPPGFKGTEKKKDEFGRWYTMASTRDVWEIDMVGRSSTERSGYPTQKPLTLLDRIVKVSSKSGDIVLDPFCGCGTTIVAAENNNRNWIGIDITYSAIAAIQKRLEGHTKLRKKVEIINKPETRAEVEALLQRAQSSLYVKKEFEKFIVAQIGGFPNEKMGADGLITLSTQQKAVISVKSGHVNVAQVRSLKGGLDGQKYVAGVFVTRQKSTKNMIDFANKAGLYKPEQKNASLKFENPFPILQILTLDDVLRGQLPDLPYASVKPNNLAKKTFK